MNRTVAIMLLFALTGTNFSRFFIYEGFSLNKKYIVTTLCENKNKPWMHCNGKCYLMKKLGQAEEKQKSEDRPNKKNLFQETLIEPEFRINFHAGLIAIIATLYTRRHFTVPARTIIQPPG